MRAKASRVLSRRDTAADPAGQSKMTLSGTGKPQGWNFDDDIPVEQPRGPFNGSASFPGPSSRPEEPKIKRRRRKWRWPWDKDDVQQGERVIALNDFSGQQNGDFCSNYISTSKYNVASFVPKFLFGEFALLSRKSRFLFSCRTVQQVCELVLPFYCLHPTSPRSLTDKSIHYHCASRCRLVSIRVQRKPGRFEAAPVRQRTERSYV